VKEPDLFRLVDALFLNFLSIVSLFLGYTLVALKALKIGFLVKEEI